MKQLLLLPIPCVWFLCFLSSCSSVKIDYLQRGFHAFSSRDTILLSFHELPEELHEFALRYSAKKISCPAILYAQSSIIDELLFSKGIFLTKINKSDSATLKRIGGEVHTSHFVNCLVTHDTDLNTIELYSNEEDTGYDWSKIRFDVYELNSGKCIEQLTIRVNKQATILSDKEDRKVLQVHRSGLGMFTLGYKRGIKRLFKNCI